MSAPPIFAQFCVNFSHVSIFGTSSVRCFASESQVDFLKMIRQIPSTNVLIRDVTGLDTSTSKDDRKSRSRAGRFPPS